MSNNGEVTQAAIDEHMLPVWIADHQTIYTTVAQWASDDPFFAGNLDETKIASFGHSFGGAVSLEVCRIDSRCKAAVNLDGGLYGGSTSLPSNRPLMLMTSADSNQFPKAVADWKTMIDLAEAPAYWLEIPKSNHYSFTIGQLISPILVSKGFDPESGSHTIEMYVRAFFDTHLRGTPTIPLDPTSTTSDVQWRTK